MPVIAIYPGSFDPITNGHLDLIDRASKHFDRLIVAILRNETKEPLFSVDERMEMLRAVIAGYPNVELDSFDGLLVDYADLDGNLLIANDPFSGVKVKEGKLILPDRPGLGLKPA